MELMIMLASEKVIVEVTKVNKIIPDIIWATESDVVGDS